MLQLHGRGDPADAHVWAFIVVAPKPAGGKILYFFKALKEILIQPVIAYCPVVSFDIAVLMSERGGSIKTNNLVYAYLEQHRKNRGVA